MIIKTKLIDSDIVKEPPHSINNLPSKLKLCDRMLKALGYAIMYFLCRNWEKRGQASKERLYPKTRGS